MINLREQENANASDPMRANSDSVSNESNENDLQNEKHDGQRV
jgi:hypothetical protein